MFQYIWPVALIVASNLLYQICAKTMLSMMDPFASLTVTYFVSALLCLILFFVFNRGGNLIKEYQKINFAPIVFGLVLVGLEAGNVFAYRYGWQVSVLPLLQSAILAVLLIVVGKLLFKEPITVNKIVGIVICLTGLFFMNKN